MLKSAPNRTFLTICLATTVGVLIAICITLFSHKIIEHKIQSVLDRLKRGGVDIASYDLSATKLEFHGLSFTKQNATITRLKIYLNKFSASLVFLQGLKANIDLSQYFKMQVNKGGSSGRGFLSYIADSKLMLRGGELKIKVHNSVPPIEIQNVDAQGDKEQTRFWLNNLKIGSLELGPIIGVTKFTGKELQIEFTEAAPKKFNYVNQLVISPGRIAFNGQLLDSQSLAKDFELIKSKNLNLALVLEPQKKRTKIKLTSGHLRIKHKRLANDPLFMKDVAIDLDMRLNQTWLPKRILRGRIAVNANSASELKANFSGIINREIQLSMENASCPGLLKGLQPNHLDQSFTLGGNFSIHSRFHLNFDKPHLAFLKIPSFKFGCKVLASSFDYNLSRLATQGPVLSAFQRKSRHFLSSMKYYAPFADISKDAVLAVLSSEDIGFYHHQGFNLNAINEALRRNLSARKIKFGASTISMQTAKNLFLNPDKTLMRKLEEAFLTWHLEQSLTKQRILEIYLNIIELGPAIYGLAHAASIYFDKAASELNLKESIFLATLMPNPRKRFRHYCRSQTSEAFTDLMNQKLEQLYTLQKISEEQYKQTKSQPLKFAKADPKVCAGSFLSINADAKPSAL